MYLGSTSAVLTPSAGLFRVFFFGLAIARVKKSRCLFCKAIICKYPIECVILDYKFILESIVQYTAEMSCKMIKGGIVWLLL